jgi:hypothetical protein
MKHLFLPLVLSIFLCTSLHAQTTNEEELPANYFGLGTGINANTGMLGITFEHIFKEHIGAFANVGVGGWGYKLGVGGRLYFKNAHSGAVGINFSHCTGQTGLSQDLAVIEGGKSVTKKVTYDQHPVDVLNVTYLKFWKLGKKARFNIETGWSVPLNGKGSQNYTIVGPPGVVLDQNSVNALNSSQPGGLIIAIGFTFGF